jgi:hypothetical protein
VGQVKYFLKENTVRLLIIFLLFAYWVPILRFGFDPHHDGLILATVYETDVNSPPAPFNQYGPAWFLLLKVGVGLVSPDYFFLALRVVTFTCYFFAIVVTYLLAKHFLTTKSSLNTIILLLGIQPFVTDFNSGMIPWPSALSMILIPLAALFLITTESPQRSSRAILLDAAAGFTVFVILLTRFQIGLAIFIGCIVLLLLYRLTRKFLSFLGGFTLALVLFLIYSIKVQILSNIIDDVIGFGSTYILGDKSTYPKPIWTFVLTLTFIFIYVALHYSPILRPTRLTLTLLAVCLFLFLVFTFLILSARDLSPVQILTVASRRVWIAGLLATAISSVFILLFHLVRQRKLPAFKLPLLIGFGFVAELQVYPLFDQMHAWWGATPIIILTLLNVLTHKQILCLSKLGRKIIEALVLSIVLATSSITFYSTLNHDRVPLQIKGFSGILIDWEESREITSTNSFLAKQIATKDQVLNLCTNANVFFDSVSRPSSASRAFVFWTPMFRLDSLRDDILSSRPTKIVTCSLVTNPVFFQEYQSLQFQILEFFSNDLSEPVTFVSPEKVIWKVYSTRY